MVSVDIETDHVPMTRKLFLLLLFTFSSFMNSEMINFECSTQNSDREFSFKLLLGTATQRAIQTTRRGQIQMDFIVTDEYYELGQFIEENKQEILPIIKINKKTLRVDFAKYMDLVEPILCIKI